MAATATPPARGASSSSAPAAPAAAPPSFSWEKAFECDTRVPQMHQFMEQILHDNFPVVPEKLRKAELPARRYEPAPHQQQQQYASRPAANAPVANGVARPQPPVERAPPVPQQQASPVAPPQPSVPSHPSYFLLHESESASEVDMREVDPMDELSDFETQPPSVNNGGRNRHAASTQPRRVAEANGDDEMNGGDGGNDFEMEGDDDADVSGLLVTVMCTRSCCWWWLLTSHMCVVVVVQDDDDEEETACVVCNNSENEKQILLCDKCDAGTCPLLACLWLLVQDGMALLTLLD